MSDASGPRWVGPGVPGVPPTSAPCLPCPVPGLWSVSAGVTLAGGATDGPRTGGTGRTLEPSPLSSLSAPGSKSENLDKNSHGARTFGETRPGTHVRLQPHPPLPTPHTESDLREPFGEGRKPRRGRELNECQTRFEELGSLVDLLEIFYVQGPEEGSDDLGLESRPRDLRHKKVSELWTYSSVVTLGDRVQDR